MIVFSEQKILISLFLFFHYKLHQLNSPYFTTQLLTESPGYRNICWLIDDLSEFNSNFS